MYSLIFFNINIYVYTELLKKFWITLQKTVFIYKFIQK